MYNWGMWNEKLKRAVNRFGPALLWMTLIFIGSSLPSARVSDDQLVDLIAHKSVHLLEYSILAILLRRATGSWLSAILIAGVFSFSDEYHQTFVPGRNGRWQDSMVDIFGAILGWFCLTIKAKVKYDVESTDKKVQAAVCDGQAITCNSVAETKSLARLLLPYLENGGVLALYGDLGAGKTTFVQGLAKALRINQRVNSPSFVLMREFTVPNGKKLKKLVHVDLYRLTNVIEIESLGLEEKFNEPKTLTVIEWPERLGDNLPKAARKIEITITDENHRLFKLRDF